MEATAAISNGDIVANFQGGEVSALIDSSSLDNQLIQSTISPDGAGKYIIELKSDGAILNGEISWIDTVQLTLAITKGSVTVPTEMDIGYRDMLYLPKVAKASDKFLYVMEGRYHMTGGWLNDRIQSLGKYPVFKTDINPIKSFFRNKLYQHYDPVTFAGNLSKFAFTSARINSTYTGYHTTGLSVPEAVSIFGTSEYTSISGSGTVGWSVDSGILDIETGDADSDDGHAVFKFTFPDSLYTDQFFHMPCGQTDQVPIAVAIDGKIMYDKYNSLMDIQIHSHGVLLGAKAFFTFLIDYVHILGAGVIAHLLMMLPFIFMTRGMICGMIGSIETVFQLVYFNLHMEGVNAVSGGHNGFANKFGILHRTVGNVLSNTTRGLSRVQQDYVMGQLLSPMEDSLYRGKSKQGLLMIGFLCVVIPIPVLYSDGVTVNPPGLGACWETDLHEMYDNNEVPDDDFRAMCRKHTTFSVSETVIFLMSKIGNMSYPGFSGSLSRIIKNGKFNEISGIEDPLYYHGRKWSSTDGSGDKTTVDGTLSQYMRGVAQDRFARFSFGNGNDDGQAPSRLHDRPTWNGNWGATRGVGPSIQIAHIDIDNETVRIWKTGSRVSNPGALQQCKIVKPNNNIILAI